jgi:hypothetical protein
MILPSLEEIIYSMSVLPRPIKNHPYPNGFEISIPYKQSFGLITIPLYPNEIPPYPKVSVECVSQGTTPHRINIKPYPTILQTYISQQFQNNDEYKRLTSGIDFQELETPGQTALRTTLETFYYDVSQWLRYLILGETEIFPSLLIPRTLATKPDADFEIEILKLFRQMWLKVPLAQELAPHGAEELWALYLICNAQFKLKSAGYYGTQAPLTKRKTYKGSLRDSTAIQRAIDKPEKYDLPEMVLYSTVDLDQLLNHLFSTALMMAVEQDDDDLLHHCNLFNQAWRHRIKILEEDPIRQIPYLNQDRLCSTGKGMKILKPRTDASKRRSRGRPPKGSK